MEANNNLPAQQPEAPFSVEVFKELSNNALDNLNATKEQRAKAEKLYSQLKELPLDAKSDKLRSTFINRCKITVKAMKDRRTPFTQMVDAVKKMFTSEEAWMDNAIKEIQEQRNKYATAEAKRIEAEREKARLELERKNTLVVVKQNAALKIVEIENEVITAFNKEVSEYLMSLTIAVINSAIPSKDNIVKLPGDVNSKLHEKVMGTLTDAQKRIIQPCADEVKEIIETIALSFNEKRVIEECDKANQRAANDLPALKKKLQEAEKDAAKAEEIKAQIAEKAKADEELANKVVNDAQVEAEKNVAAQASTEQIQNQLELQMAEQVVEGKKKKEIIILEPGGYVKIFSMWFEHEGKDLTDAKIQNMTIARMVTFCEKLASEKNILIASPDISYQDKVVAK